MLVRPTVRHTTLSREAYLSLRALILKRRLRPGTKLIVRLLSEELGLSPTPVKEALAALEREGLVMTVPHRGYFIPRITPEDIQDIYRLREVVEGLAARLAAERANPGLADKLAQLLERQRRAAKTRQVERYGDLDLSFHHAIWEGARSERILRVAEAFFGQVRLFISTSATVPGRLSMSLEEHEAILRAMAASDCAGAEGAMRRHIRDAGLVLKEYLEKTNRQVSPSQKPA